MERNILNDRAMLARNIKLGMLGCWGYKRHECRLVSLFLPFAFESHSFAVSFPLARLYQH